MAGRRLSDRVHVHADGESLPAFSGLAFEQDDEPRDLWNLDHEEQRRKIAARAAKGARATRRQQFGGRA